MVDNASTSELIIYPRDLIIEQEIWKRSLMYSFLEHNFLPFVSFLLKSSSTPVLFKFCQFFVEDDGWQNLLFNFLSQSINWLKF